MGTADMEASPGGEVSEKQSCIKRGVPKITKQAPPVVAVKMADLLGSPEGALNEQGITEKDENVETTPKELDSSEPPTEAMERERKEKEDKLQKQQQQKLDKQKKREDEARAKKEKDLEEKRQKQIREKIEKQKKEEEKQKKVEEAKAKKEKERKAKLEKQEKEKLEKLQKEQEAKAKKQIELTKKKSKEEQQIHDNDENKVPYDSEEGTREDFEQENDEGDTKGEFKPTESVIKRGKPKNTKPSPAVVAIKMKDLVGAPNVTDDSKVDDHTNESCTNKLTVSPSQDPYTNNQPFSGENEVNDMKALHEEKFKIE